MNKISFIFIFTLVMRNTPESKRDTNFAFSFCFIYKNSNFKSHAKPCSVPQENLKTNSHFSLLITKKYHLFKELC